MPIHPKVSRCLVDKIRLTCAMNKTLKSSLLLLLLLSGCTTDWKTKSTADSPEYLLTCVRKHVQTVVLADTREPMGFAGHYTSGSGLSGAELYLFPDRTYMYTEWADIQAETLYDRGTWSCLRGVIRLSSDESLSKMHPRDKMYVGMYYEGKTPLDPLGNDREKCSGIVLMGTRWDFSMYSDIVKSDLRVKWADQEVFESSFLLCTHKKVDDIRSQDIEEKKRSLTKEVWIPGCGE